MASPKKKVSRKELLKKEPPPILTLWERVAAWVKANQRAAAVAATVLAVLVALIVGVRKYDAYKESRAMALYGQAQAALGPEGEASAKGLEALSSVADQYPNTRAARYAQLEQANLLYGQGKMQEAAAIYEDCLKRFKHNDELDLLARQGLAYCRLSLGDLGGAQKLFKELAAADLGAGTAKLNLGLIYELQGNLVEAVAAYREAAKLAAGPEAALARARLAALVPGRPGGA